MEDFDYTVESSKGFDATVAAVEAQSAEKGFRVLVVHDVKATLESKGFAREPMQRVDHQDVSTAFSRGGRRSIIFLTSDLFDVNKCLNKSLFRGDRSSRQQKTTALAVERILHLLTGMSPHRGGRMGPRACSRGSICRHRMGVEKEGADFG